ncbi:MAG: hypothetical protein K8I60_11885 [Anaerolineae bacterium]|nr:hypothetical protein [Anaerolineae bacterium]
MTSIRDTGETHSIGLVDLPLVRRLAESGAILDSESYYTRGGSGASFFTLLMPNREVHTLVTRFEKQQLVGQFRLRANEHHAHIIYIAPDLDMTTGSDSAWLSALDALAGEAGRRGAHTLAAEVDETAPLFETLRAANYAIYARQEIWQHQPIGDGELPAPLQEIELTAASPDDIHGIHLLYGNIVPRLVQQVSDLPEECEGLVYRKHDRVEGFIAISEGKYGLYLMPHLHPDIFSEAGDIMLTALAWVGHARKPIFVRVRRYQDWLDHVLDDLGFTMITQQALLIKHIAAGVRTTPFTPLHQKLEGIPAPVKPPTPGITDTYSDMDLPTQETRVTHGTSDHR